MKNFESSFNRSRKIFNVIFVFNLIVFVVIFVGTIYFGWFLIKNPESIGQFFGEIFKGFNQINK
jgi:hypothetical protein